MPPIEELLRIVIDLQSEYTTENSDAMRRRGELIRRDIPQALKPILDAAGSSGSELAIEGRDGVGLKSKVPWVRIFAPSSSPSATQGWYLVLLFPIDGSGVFLSLNQGTTTHHRGAFTPRSMESLRERVQGARARLLDSSSASDGLIETIDLGDSGSLATGYERGNVFARFYPTGALPDASTLTSHIGELVPMLRLLYSSDLSETSTERGSYLLVWNPQGTEWPELRSLGAETLAGRRLAEEGRWSTVSGRILPGDRLFVVRVGAGPEGIVASGVASSRPVEAPDWDGEPGHVAHFVSCNWDYAIDPEVSPPFSLDDLRMLDAEFPWTPQASGIALPPKTASLLETAWISHIRSLGQLEPSQDQPESAPPYSLADLQAEAFFADDQVAEMLALLRSRLNLVLQGPPGVGKTFLAKKLAYALMGERDDERIEWIQFHQSYSYEEFVEGFRPVEGGGFRLRRGVFHRFCEFASKRSPEPCVFIIDEINRGNLSRIFGELLSLIEEDKRSQLSVRLAYSPDESRFTVPTNVYIIGLMNTADRSLAVVDYALRRRFRFADLSPQFESSRFKAHLVRMGISYGLVDRIRSRMSLLNAAIAEDTRNLGKGFEVGHSFFSPTGSVTDEEAWYRRVIKFEIAPLLREYWFDSPDRARSWEETLLKGDDV